MTKFVIGKDSQREPEVRFWLEDTTNGVCLCAQMDSDGSSQNVAIICLENGVLNIQSKRLFQRNLCETFGLSVGDAPSISTEPRP